MEIKLIARVLGAEERTTTREAFWQELRSRYGASWEPAEIAEGPITAEDVESRIYEMLPRLLKERIQAFILQHPQVRRTQVLRRFRRRSVLGEDFLIAVTSLRYGSLEILLNFLAGDGFPLSTSDVVQLLTMHAPSVLSYILRAPLAVAVSEPTGSLPGEGRDADEGGGQPALVRRAFYLANFSLLVPVALFLVVGYVIFHAMVAQISAVDEERRALVHDLLAQATKVDGDRSQLIKDALDLAKENGASAADLYRQLIELKKEQSEKPNTSGPGKDKASNASPPPSPSAQPEGTLLDRQVNFEFNSAELDREMQDALGPLAEMVRAGHTAILIEGHADGVGTAAYNQRLSQKRADAVRKFLVDKGVPASQMHTYGYGQGYFWFPYAPSDAANRRVRVIECTVAGGDRCKSAPPERL